MGMVPQNTTTTKNMEQKNTQKNYTALFRVLFSIDYRGAIDGAPYALSETVYDSLFTGRVSAFAKAQSLFDRQPLNGHVLSKHVVVFRLSPDARGQLKSVGRVYNRYEEVPHDIYGNVLDGD